MTFTSRPAPEQDRWTVKNAENGHVEWAFDSARRGGRVLTASTPDGRIVATAFGDNTVSCRESSTGGSYSGTLSEAPLRTLALSADGRTLVAACESGVVELRSLATGRRVVLPISEAPRKNAQPSSCIFTRWNQGGDDRMGHPRRGHAGHHLGRRHPASACGGIPVIVTRSPTCSSRPMAVRS